MTKPEPGTRWWLDTERYWMDQTHLGEVHELPVGRWPDVVEVAFTVVRVDRLRNRLLLEAP